MGLFDWLKPAPPPDPAVQAHIDQAVQAIDPRIKQVAGYERKLAPAVRHALAHCVDVAARIPGPIEISRAAFGSDPLVHALFASADAIEQMFATSQCVREHFAQMIMHTDRCCALLGMRLHEKASFGTQLEGEIVRSDVPQKTLYFSDHTLAEPAPDEASARQRLADAMFDGMIKAIAEHVEGVRAERAGLDQEKAFAAAQLRAGQAVHGRRLAGLQERLAATADALQPQRLLETLVDSLNAPEALLRLEPIELCVDRTGIIRNDASEGDMLHFCRLISRDPRQWVVLLVQIDHAEVRRALERFETARHFIVI
ncbi:hypothetical protein [Sulfuricystis multivorans]|uniref:hypothetical protein n=1 Tax=Sulfuricystis multivorans TaxID=2211108 RepID=UPI000F84D266|nr:hypothetical protein [Sulfuricystis multivorans]